jgi:hypothetical protein
MIPEDVGYLVASEPTAADERLGHLVPVCLQQDASRPLVKILPGKHGQSDLPCLKPGRCRDLPLSFCRKGIQPGKVAPESSWNVTARLDARIDRESSGGCDSLVARQPERGTRALQVIDDEHVLAPLAWPGRQQQVVIVGVPKHDTLLAIALGLHDRATGGNTDQGDAPVQPWERLGCTGRAQRTPVKVNIRCHLRDHTTTAADRKYAAISRY